MRPTEEQDAGNWMRVGKMSSPLVAATVLCWRCSLQFAPVQGGWAAVHSLSVCQLHDQPIYPAPHLLLSGGADVGQNLTRHLRKRESDKERRGSAWKSGLWSKALSLLPQNVRGTASKVFKAKCAEEGEAGRVYRSLDPALCRIILYE